MNYYRIIENNEWEGESWEFFLKEEGNEKFIKKLKEALEKFGADHDLGISIEEELVPEFEVDVLVKYRKSNYMYSHNKVDKVLDPKTIKTKKYEDFTDCIYKGGLFG
jgi:hypothetical protein